MRDCEDARRPAAPADVPWPAASIQVRDVLRKILDVGVGQGAGDARHVAGIVRAAPRLEILELLLDVVVLLPGDARYLVLPDELALVAHRAQHLVGLLAARHHLGAVGDEAVRRLLLLREIVGDRQHVRLRERRGDRIHRRVLAPPFLEVTQLQVDVACVLPRQDRKRPAGGIAAGTVAGDAGLDLVLDRGVGRRPGLRGRAETRRAKMQRKGCGEMA